MKRNVYVAVAFVALLAALGVGSAVLEKRAAVEAAAVPAPSPETASTSETAPTATRLALRPLDLRHIVSPFSLT